MAANLPYNATLAGAMAGLLAIRDPSPLGATPITTVTTNAAGIAHAAASIANQVGTVQVASLSVACTTSDLQTLLQNCAEAACTGKALTGITDTDGGAGVVAIAQETIGYYNAAAAKVTA